MTKVDIVLGGGRQLPNILGAYRDDCDLVDVVASGDQPKAVEGLRVGLKVLGSSGAANIRMAEVAPTQYVDAFDPSAILKACRELVARHADQGEEIIFNVTCGTTVMSVMACQAARERDIPAIYIDTQNGRIVDLTALRVRDEPSSVKSWWYLAINSINLPRCLSVRRCNRPTGDVQQTCQVRAVKLQTANKMRART